MLVLPAFFSHAQTAAELNQKIDQKNADIAKLEREIAGYQRQLEKLGEEKDSLNNSIKQLDLSRKKLLTDISVTQNKIDKTNLKIQELSLQIGDKESIILNNRKAIGVGIRKTNELELSTPIEVILSDTSFSEIWNDVENMTSIQEAIIERTAELKDAKVVLEDTREETTEAKNELVRLRSQLSDQKKVVEQNTADKKKLLTQTKNSEANYQKLVKEQQKKKLAYEKEIEDYESQLKYILDPSKIPSGRVLAWPLNSIYITSPYGPRWGRFHRGTDFRASVGTLVKAMADGVVIGTGDTDVCCPKASFGKWVLIHYNNGLSSTYGHLSLVSVSKGQRVSRGQVVAYSGNSGSSTGPHLHVSVYVSDGVKVDSFESKSYPGRILVQPIASTNAYLDPMDFLPPYNI